MPLSGDRLERLILQYDRNLNGAESVVLERVDSALLRAYRVLEQELLRSYRRNADAPLLPNQRRLLVMDEISAYLNLLGSGDRAQVQSDFERLLLGSTEAGTRLSEELIRAIANESLQPFAGVPLDAVRLQAETSAARLYRWSDDFKLKISGVVEMGLAAGSSPQKIATALRSELGIVRGRAEAIARTESLSAFNLAAQSRYQAQGISHVQLIATADNRICPYCAGRNGNVYRLGDIAVPLHVRCRCFLTPWKPEWAAAGLTDDAWVSEFRARAIAELSEAGQQPNYGLAPFERANGRTEPPTPIRSF
jgi:SPP1 gp7 family putative phage head morphogenesis protein